MNFVDELGHPEQEIARAYLEGKEFSGLTDGQVVQLLANGILANVMQYHLATNPVQKNALSRGLDPNDHRPLSDLGIPNEDLVPAIDRLMKAFQRVNKQEGLELAWLMQN